MAWIKPPHQMLTEHFSTSELVCRHCGKAPSLATLETTALWLENVRTALGDYPIRISSGVRCEDHNRAVGGAEDSYHVRGWAADITIRDLSPAEVHRRCKVLQREGKVGGLGRYRGFTHIDRGVRRSWSGY